MSMQNTNVGFQSLAITLNQGGRTNVKVETQIICKQSEQEKILNCYTQSAYDSLKFFLHLC